MKGEWKVEFGKSMLRFAEISFAIIIAGALVKGEFNTKTILIMSIGLTLMLSFLIFAYLMFRK